MHIECYMDYSVAVGLVKVVQVECGHIWNVKS
jgi:hypothetical protein